MFPRSNKKAEIVVYRSDDGLQLRVGGEYQHGSTDKLLSRESANEALKQFLSARCQSVGDYTAKREPGGHYYYTFASPEAQAFILQELAKPHDVLQVYAQDPHTLPGLRQGSVLRIPSGCYTRRCDDILQKTFSSLYDELKKQIDVVNKSQSNRELEDFVHDLESGRSASEINPPAYVILLAFLQKQYQDFGDKHALGNEYKKILYDFRFKLPAEISEGNKYPFGIHSVSQYTVNKKLEAAAKDYLAQRPVQRYR